MHKTLTTIFVRIKSSDNNMHVEDHLVICALKMSKRLALVPGTRMLWLREHYGVFIIEAMQGVVIATQRMHIEL